jgi:hypothetical protein
METKPIYKSKTAWGAVAMLAGAALSHYNISVDTAEIEQHIAGVLSAAGFLITLYGRITAVLPIKIFG